MAIIEMRRLTGSWQAMEIAVWARPLTRGEIYAVVEFYDQLLVGTPAPVPTHTGPYTGRLKLIGSGDKVGQCTDTCRVYSNHCRPIACGDGHSKIKWWANGYIQVGIERGCIAAWASEGCVAGAEYCLGLRSDQMVQKRECAASVGAPQMHRHPNTARHSMVATWTWPIATGEPKCLGMPWPAKRPLQVQPVQHAQQAPPSSAFRHQITPSDVRIPPGPAVLSASTTHINPSIPAGAAALNYDGAAAVTAGAYFQLDLGAVNGISGVATCRSDFDGGAIFDGVQAGVA
jgi:hypothetical protein